MRFRTYIISSICGVLTILLVTGLVVYYVDPYFQYHVPRDNLVYDMETNNFSYYNAGIAKNFSYDTVITGSSMSRSFLTSYIDQQFSCHSVKLSMAEARGKDFSILLPLVTENSGLKRIIIGLDTFAFNVDKDYSAYEKPMYLYDDNLFNDVLYLINMDGVVQTFEVLKDTVEGGTTTTMDDYQNYVTWNTFSKEKVLKIYQENVSVQQSSKTNVEDLEEYIIDNINQNLIPTIKNNPDVEFLFYFPPYSIVKWGLLYEPSVEINSMRIIIEQLIEYPNVSLYFYQGEQGCITNLNHYMDTIHFDSVVANDIVDYMMKEDNKLTIENYQNVLDEFKDFIGNYDYDVLLKNNEE